MQILTRRGGYITVHSVRSNEVSFYIMVTVHTPLSREVFWHENAKIPRHTARIYANSINSVHREACYWARSEQQHIMDYGESYDKK